MLKKAVVGISLAMLGCRLTSPGMTSAAEAEVPKLGPLKVEGLKLLNEQGQPVRLRGVNAASLEWSTTGEGHILESVRVAVEQWRSNLVRVPLSQDCWFGKAPKQSDEGDAYRDLVRQVVNSCVRRGAYVLLDLHWSDAGTWGKEIGQHVMPDRNSLTFWEAVAEAYRDEPAVLFDLYNEPHDVSWDVWLKGGEVRDRNDKGRAGEMFEAVGMQRLLNVVRAKGARNVVVVGGLNWSYDLSGILEGRKLADPDGRGVLYANHAYPFKGDTVEAWEAKMEVAGRELPLYIGEFGSDPKGRTGQTGEEWVKQVLEVLRRHDWHWTAWDFHPFARPALIAGWDYAPTAHFGTWVKPALEEAPFPLVK